MRSSIEILAREIQAVETSVASFVAGVRGRDAAGAKVDRPASVAVAP
jgi:phage tail sheath protein FI